MSSKKSVDDYLKALGRISVNFTRIESFLGIFVGELISEDFGLNLCVVAGSGMMELVNLFRALFRYRVAKSDLIKRCQAVLSKIEDVNDRRNRFLHSEWVLGEFDGTVVAWRTKLKKRSKHGLQSEFENNNYEEINVLLENMQSTLSELTTLMTESRELIVKHRKENQKRNHVQFGPK